MSGIPSTSLGGINMPPAHGIWHRFMQDCRDLWSLIRHGQPDEDDSLYLSRLVVEIAKIGIVEENLDEWEGEMFAKDRSAFWFDPKRYDDTPWAWPRRDVIKSMEAQVAVLTQQHSMVNMQNSYLNQLANYQSQIHAQNCYGNYQSPFLNQSLGLQNSLGGLFG